MVDKERDPSNISSDAECQAIYAELDRRFQIALNLMPEHTRREADEANVSHHELSTLLLGELLAHPQVWEAITANATHKPSPQKKRRRHGPSGGTRAKRLERLARSYECFPQPIGTKSRDDKLAAFTAEKAKLLTELEIHASGQALLNLISRGRALARQRDDVKRLTGLQRQGITLAGKVLDRDAIRRYRRSAAVDGKTAADTDLKMAILQLELSRRLLLGVQNGLVSTPSLSFGLSTAGNIVSP